MKSGEIVFRCPDCDGGWFRTTFDMKDGKIVDSTMVGYCTTESGCEFRWPRSEDWKVFVQLNHFESKEEYEGRGAT